MMITYLGEDVHQLHHLYIPGSARHVVILCKMKNEFSYTIGRIKSQLYKIRVNYLINWIKSLSL